MSGIATTVGLISGINTGTLVDSLIRIKRQPAVRMEAQVKSLQGRQAALKTTQATLVTLASSVNQLKSASTFEAFTVSTTDVAQMTVTPGNSAVPGEYQFRSVQTARAHELVSAGAANSTTQTFGAGQLVIAMGGGLDQGTSLAALNDGEGIRRGSIRITDRSGSSATVDLSNAFSVNDVLDAVNNASGIAVSARAEGGRLVLEDTTGSTLSNLTVTDLNGGNAAADLGIAGSVAASTLSGATVYRVTGDFALEHINDGNGLSLTSGDDLQITLTDDSVVTVDLDGAKTVNDILNKINEADSNGGKLLASLNDGRIVLEDQSGGGGTSAFATANIGNARVVTELGLDAGAAGTTLTGRKLAGGLNSVLLRNLRGGRGITQMGSVSLTDRAGRNSVIDLSAAESLDDVTAAINGAKTVGDVRLSLTARVNAAGTGIEILDDSGLSTSNLVIADVGGSTVAADLGIAVDAAETSVNSGPLGLRSVNEATSLATFAPGAKPVPAGSFKITDSTGAQATIAITSADKTIGDVLRKINEAAGIQVTARLNDTGDGIAVEDDAGGATALKIEEVSGKAGTALRLVGEGVDNGQGQSVITARRAVVVSVEADDTLNDIVGKINAAGEKVSASTVNTGSPVNPIRMIVRSGVSGRDGTLFVEEGNLGLGLSTRVRGRDAVLQVGADASGSYYLSSSTNTFTQAVGGLDIRLQTTSQTATTATVRQDGVRAQNALKSLVTGYNAWLTSYRTATSYNSTTSTSGALQGDGFTLRIKTKLESIVSARYAPNGSSVRTLQDLGVFVGQDGSLQLDSDKLNAAMQNDSQAVEDFFRSASKGFAEVLGNTLDELTDPLTGSFKSQDDTLQRNVDTLSQRITQLDTILVGQRLRLITQFSKMETTLASLQDSQQSLNQLVALSNSSRK